MRERLNNLLVVGVVSKDREGRISCMLQDDVEKYSAVTIGSETNADLLKDPKEGMYSEPD